MALDIKKFIKKPEYDILITTYRDVFQKEKFEYDRFSDEYLKLSRCIFFGKKSLKKMGLKQGDKVKVFNENGSVVLEVRETKRDESDDIGFMLNSKWSNTLVSAELGDIPEFKYIKAKISLM